MDFKNYPPLPGGLALIVYSHIDLRTAQKQMARECWNCFKAEYLAGNDERFTWLRAMNFLEERFGPFDE